MRDAAPRAAPARRPFPATQTWPPRAEPPARPTPPSLSRVRLVPRRAYRLLQAMRERGIAVTQFLDASDVEAIHRAVGEPLGGGRGGAGSDGEDQIDEEIDEDVE